MTGLRTVLLLALLAGVLTACADGREARRLPVEALHADSHCGDAGPAPSLRLARDHAERRALLEPLGLDDRSSAGGDAPARRAVALISMGHKPTGGFSLALREDTVRLADGVLTLAVHWRAPPEGAIVTQAFTRPCLVVALPPGDFRQLRVVDQDGGVRIRHDP